MKFNKFYISTADTKSPEQMQRAVNTLQQNVQDSLSRIEKNTLLDNVIISGVLISTSKSVEHKLGRTPKGYLIIQKNANAQVWNGSITDTNIVLTSSAAVTVTLLIF